MANAKVIVTTRFVVDSKIIYTGSKLHDDSATVKLVIDTALERNKTKHRETNKKQKKKKEDKRRKKAKRKRERKEQ